MKYQQTIVKYSVLTLLLALSQFSTAQLDKANRFYSNYLFTRAEKEYLLVLEKDSTNATALLQLAECYIHTGRPELAVKTYNSCPFEFKDKPIHNFYFAEALSALQRYEEAAVFYNTYEDLVGKSQWIENKKDIPSHLVDFYSDSSHYSIVPFEYNSKFFDFAPAYFQNGLLFSSDRLHPDQRSHDLHFDERRFLNIFYIYKEGGIPENFNNAINSQYHESGVSFNKDENRIIFSRSAHVHREPSNNELGPLNIQLFIANKNKEGWDTPQPFVHNSEDYLLCDPSVSDDFEELFFASDMNGGYGGTDIYVCYFQNGKWGSPINLGSTINTPGNERTPFITENGTLYFASDGLPGLGGLDLFVTHERNFQDAHRLHQYDKSKGLDFAPPVNLGFPVNSSRDDFALILSDSQITGYLTSNRPGGKGLDDIYKLYIR